MEWNSQQEYPYLQLHQQEWNPYAARTSGMWNMMSIFPGLLPGANLSHTGLTYPINGNSSVPHLGSFPTSGLNKRAGELLCVPQAGVSPPLSPHDAKEQPYEPLKLTDPSLPLTSSSSSQLPEPSLPLTSLSPPQLPEPSLPLTSLSPPQLPEPSLPQLPEPSLPLTSLPPPQLPEPSLPLTSLSLPQLPEPSLPLTSLSLPQLPEPSLPLTSLSLPQLSEPSLPLTSLSLPQLSEPSLPLTSLSLPQLSEPSLPLTSLVLPQLPEPSLPLTSLSPPRLPEPSLPLTSLSPPHSPTLDLPSLDMPPLDLNDTKYPKPTGILPTNPFLHPSLGTTPFPLSQDFTLPQTPQEPSEEQVLPLTAAAALINSQIADTAIATALALFNPQKEDVATRDANGRKLPRWMIKRSMCPVCKKRFESRHKLQLHMYCHTGEKPHICETCGMKFGRKFCYKRHLKTHTLIKPHNCTRCGRAFREKYDMETHLMTEVCLRAMQAAEQSAAEQSAAEQSAAGQSAAGQSAAEQSTSAVERSFTCKECKISFTSWQEYITHSEVHKESSSTNCSISNVQVSHPEHLTQDPHENIPGYTDNQENQTNQLDPLELQFNLQEQMAAYRRYQTILYHNHKPGLYHSTETDGDTH